MTSYNASTVDSQHRIRFPAAAAQILQRESDPNRPSLETRVAFQWERQSDLLGFRSGARKDHLLLKWLSEAVRGGSGRPAVLDVGCAYGNFLLMLQAFLGKPEHVHLVGVDLHEGSLEYARAFVGEVDGYSNCQYEKADLSQRLPFDDGTFDAINLGDVLEHMEDPGHALRELIRVAKPGGMIVISTPLKNSLFKRLARLANAATGGRLYRKYYRGKDTLLDESGEPVMDTKVGHDHISEMSFKQLLGLVRGVGLVVEAREVMTVMSGSKWFDRHPFLLSALLFVEAVHDLLRFPSWAHAICLRLRVPGKLQKDAR